MTDDRSLSEYLGIGAAAAAVIIVGGAVGFAVDSGLGTLPVFVFIGLIVGVAAAVVFVYTKFRDSLRGPQQR
jgi:F0F1-type ATP synthase assembly protein I